MRTRISMTRRLEFDAGHTVTRHESKCARLHGHRYTAELKCSAPSLDDIGRVIDFGVVKEVVGGHIDRAWDHRFLIWEGDDRLTTLVNLDPNSLVIVPYNPTAENMVRHLHQIASDLLASYEVQVDSVRLYETPNGWADSLMVYNHTVDKPI